jgi:hypothetical protein
MSGGAGRIWRRRPSGAMVVAIGAVVLAAVGTALADPLASSSKLDKKEKRQVRNIATGVVESLAAGLSVADAKTADTAASAQQAANATNAANAANAATADNANTLDGQDSDDFVPSGTVVRIPTTELVDQQEINPVDLPNVDLYFTCGIDVSGDDVVEAEVAFTSAGSFVFGGTTDVDIAGTVFPFFVQTHPASGDNRITQAQVSIVSDEGTTLTGTVWAAFNLHGTTDRCFVGGNLIASG